MRYTVALDGGTMQRNIRACRVAGDTWADVHLSLTGPGDDWTPLEDVLRLLVLQPK